MQAARGARSPGERFASAWERRRAEPNAALAEARALRDAAEASGDSEALGRARLLEGSCLWRLSDYTEALRSLLAAGELLPPDSVGDQAASRLNLAVVKHYFGQNDESMELALSALELFTEIGDEAGRADVLNNLGIVFWKRGDLEEALRVYHESAEIRHRVGDLDGTAGSHNNIGKVYTEQGSYDLALRELEAARAGFSALGNRRGLGVVLNNIGIVRDRRGELDRASEKFRESLDLKERNGDRQGACETRTHLARLVAKQGRPRDALEMLARAVADAEALGVLPELAEAYRAASEVREALGEYAEALAAYRRYHETDRQLFNERSTERLHALQIAFQLDRAEREGATDGLTGLANRRSFDRQLRAAVQRAQAGERELSVALVDLDAFKSINDRFGHVLGDEVLRRVSGILRESSRASDVSARYGGEELAMIFPDTGLSGAMEVAERLCERVRGFRWSSLHRELEVTISVGVAAADGADPHALLARADRNLYRAKSTGKDRVAS